MTVNFVCVWTGDKYGPERVAILHDMVRRNASLLEDVKFWCVTDHSQADLPEGVTAIPAPDWTPGWWAKCALFSPDMPWGDGERCVYFDLDVVITGRLEDLAERSGAILDWHWAPMLNSSVMSWLHGEHLLAWTDLTPERIARPSPPEIAPLLPAGQVNGGDQEWLSEVGGWDHFPRDWFPSARGYHDWPPESAKAIIFHGSHKPWHDQRQWVRDIYKVGGLTSLPELKGVNVTEEAIFANVRSAVRRDLPWFTGFGRQSRACCIVGGAPSLVDSLSDIRAQKRRGAKVIAVNNAWRLLLANGIKPDALVLLDARPQNTEFVQGLPDGVRVFAASQCHPDVFDALEGRDVIVWHNATGDGEALREILQPWWDEGPNQRPCIMVPGGCTVVLRSLWLAAFSGYRTVHVYGADSSLEGDAHHAYPQPMNDADAVQIVSLRGKEYRAARWMIRQCEEFKWHWRDLAREGVTLHVHGRGLLPDMARCMREEARAA